MLQRLLSNNNYELQHIRSNAKDSFNVDSIVPLRLVDDNDLDTSSTTDRDQSDLDFENPLRQRQRFGALCP